MIFSIWPQSPTILFTFILVRCWGLCCLHTNWTIWLMAAMFCFRSSANSLISSWSQQSTFCAPRLSLVHCLDLQGSTIASSSVFETDSRIFIRITRSFNASMNWSFARQSCKSVTADRYAFPTSLRNELARSGSFSSHSQNLARNSALWSPLCSFGTYRSQSAAFKFP